MKKLIIDVVKRTTSFIHKLHREHPLLAMFLFGVLTGLFISFIF